MQAIDITITIYFNSSSSTFLFRDHFGFSAK